MTVQEQTVGTSVPGSTAKTVDVYDFRRPTTLPRKHARVLELANETFARQWGTHLAAKVRVMTQITPEQVEMLTYADYTETVPDSTAMVLCTIGDVSAKCVVQFPTSAALTWVMHMLGGHGRRPAPERKFTQIEHALLARQMADTLDDLQYSLGSLLTLPMIVDSIRYNSQSAQAAAPADPMIVSTFTIEVADTSCRASIAIPAEVLLPQLGEANPMSETANSTELIGAQLAHVPVDVALALTPAMVRPAAVLNLAVGDLVPLPHPQHRPLNVTVNGQALAHAAVGANGSRLAGVIVTTEEISR